DAIVSEKLGWQTIETDTTFSQMESPAHDQDNQRVDDIYSFIEIKVATKEDGKFFSRNADNGSSVNLHNQQGQVDGQCQKKPDSNTFTQQRKATESGKKSELPKHSRQQTRATPAGRTAEATSFPTKSENDRITVVLGDSIIKNFQGKKLAKAVGHRV
ncbi:unnamed protein product, partial [Porites lobata]